MASHTCARQSGRQLPVTGYVYGRMSTVLCEWNDLEAATRLAKKGVEQCKQWGWTELYVDCCVYLASALQAAGDEQGALDAIREAKRVACKVSPWYVSVVGVFEAWVRLEQGDLSLEESIALFERGQALAARCNVQLDTSELKVRQLLPDSKGETAPFD